MCLGAGEQAQDSGVEIFKSDAASFARERNLGSEARFGQVVTCRWGASLDSCVCGMAVCAAIAKLTGGSIFSDLTGEFMSVDACAAEASAILAEIMSEASLTLRREWPDKLLALLKELDPAYRLNSLVRWPGTEVVLDVGGIFYSHCSYFSGGGMDHSFAVTACLSPTGFAPFHAGARLGVGGLYDPGTSHMLRKGYEDVVRGFARKCEAQRATKYCAMLRAAAPTFLKCLELAAQNPDLLDTNAKAKRNTSKISLYPTADGLAALSREWAVAPANLAELIVVIARDGFTETRQEWPNIAERLKRLL